MKNYVIRLVELTGAGAIVGAGSYVAQNGLDLSSAGLRGLLVAAGMAAYGVLVKGLGDKDRPTLSK
jgi:hypothetical protein